MHEGKQKQRTDEQQQYHVNRTRNITKKKHTTKKTNKQTDGENEAGKTSNKQNKHIDMTAGKQQRTINQTKAQSQKQNPKTQNNNKHTNKANTLT